MSRPNDNNSVNRRDFISGILPVCAASCLACQGVLAL